MVAIVVQFSLLFLRYVFTLPCVAALNSRYQTGNQHMALLISREMNEKQAIETVVKKKKFLE